MSGQIYQSIIPPRQQGISRQGPIGASSESNGSRDPKNGGEPSGDKGVAQPFERDR